MNNIEIERKFLITGDEWRTLATGDAIRQGYLNLDPARTLRVRTSENRGWLTLKGVNEGITRREFEYEIPHEEAEELLQSFCLQPLIIKTRYRIELNSLLWEVDEYHEQNEGLITVEVELTDATQQLVKPAWIGEEISGDPRYYNSNLVVNPYCNR